MQPTWLKKVLPHVVAILIFLVITVIYCRPALESGVTMVQYDNTGVEGMTHQIKEHQKATGVYPLWNTNAFSGMPNFNILYPLPQSPLNIIDGALHLWLPQPMSFFFLACICFYILCLCVGIRQAGVAIIGSIAFAYCTYDPIIVAAGHTTKMLAMAYMPAVLGGVLLLYRKKYITGFVLTALFTALHLSQNHQQISYYIFIVIAIASLSFIVFSVKKGEIKPMLMSLGLAAIAGLLALAANSCNLLTIADYTKDTKRGGVLVMDQKGEASHKSEGLTSEYAFMWSYGKMETFSLMFPAIQGYGFHYAQKDGDQWMFPKLDENSNTAKYFSQKLNVPEDQAAGYATSMSQSLYWGPQPSTDGPVFLGAVVCILFIISMFFIDKEYKWWLLAASLVAIIMAWGNNFAAINDLLFKYLPLYNKFRAPSMILVIPQLLFPLGAVLGIQQILAATDEKDTWNKIKKAAYVTGAIFVIVGGFYFTSDFSKENKERKAAFLEMLKTDSTHMQAAYNALNQKYQPKTDNQLFEQLMFNAGKEDVASGVVKAVRQDRADFLKKDLLIALVYSLLVFGLLYAFITKKVNATVLLVGIGVVMAIELFTINTKYLNNYNFDSKEKFQEDAFPLTDADRAILQDKDPNYRVLNLSERADPFQDAKPSYYHKSVGGYHAAKLSIYDDLISYQLSGKLNPSVLNMLNTKYLIQSNPQTNKPIAIPNPEALGNAWFVKGVQYVNGPAQEMKALDQFSPKDTAVVDEKYKQVVNGQFVFDSTASIKLTKFDNDAITYESNAATAQLAVFSEIYYKDWNAYVDGKKTDVIKANYVLRAIVVPAGKHTIDFKFEPKVYLRSFTIDTIAGWLISILALGWLVKLFLDSRKSAQPAPAQKSKA